MVEQQIEPEGGGEPTHPGRLAMAAWLAVERWRRGQKRESNEVFREWQTLEARGFLPGEDEMRAAFVAGIKAGEVASPGDESGV